MKILFSDYMIRDLVKEDAPAFAKYANNRKIWKNLRDAFPHPYALSDAEEFLSRVVGDEPRTVFAIATTKEAIGCIGLMLGQDVHRHTAEMGYWLAEPFWNQGITTEAVKVFTDYAFEHFHLYRIFAEPYATNPGSIHLLEKIGYTREGTLRANALKDGKILDQLLYSQVRIPTQ